MIAKIDISDELTRKGDQIRRQVEITNVTNRFQGTT
jgi:hypothetical protein